MTTGDTISCGSSTSKVVALYSPSAELLPGGRSKYDRHSALSPQARESGSLPQGSIQIVDKMDSEGGRIELRRVSARLAAYKAVSTPNGLRLPHENTGRLRRPVSFLLVAGFRGEAESLQPVISSVDHAAIFKGDFRAEHSPVCGFGSRWFCHLDLARWTQKVHWLGWRFPSRPSCETTLVGRGKTPRSSDHGMCWPYTTHRARRIVNHNF